MVDLRLKYSKTSWQLWPFVFHYGIIGIFARIIKIQIRNQYSHYFSLCCFCEFEYKSFWQLNFCILFFSCHRVYKILNLYIKYTWNWKTTFPTIYLSIDLNVLKIYYVFESTTKNCKWTIAFGFTWGIMVKSES